jgi:hypothetical protein
MRVMIIHKMPQEREGKNKKVSPLSPSIDYLAIIDLCQTYLNKSKKQKKYAEIFG